MADQYPARVTGPRDDADPADELDLAFSRVQVGLRQALVSAGCDPARPQEVARRLNVSRNLTWKVSRALRTDVLGAIKLLPGRGGLDILLTAVAGAGGAPQVVQSAHQAVAEYFAAVERHAGDRSTLALMLDARSDPLGEPLEQARRLAFRGNSGVWGVQAQVRATSIVVAPNRTDPRTVDLAVVGGVIEFRRLRPTARWPLFRQRAYDDTGVSQAIREEPLDPDPHPTHAFLLSRFCSGNVPRIDIARTPMGTVYEAAEGPEGNPGAFTCYFGTMTRRNAPRYRTPTDDHAELYSEVSLPAAAMQFDVLVHRDIPIDGMPDATVRHAQSVTGWGGPLPLPVRDMLRELDPDAAGASSLVPGYAALLDLTMSRGPWERREFRVFRFEIRYPPMHSAALLAFPLREAP